MLGHEFKLHEANSGALIPSCECGWVGMTWWIEGGARADHARHVRADSPGAGSASRERDEYVAAVTKIVRRPNRPPELF